MRDSAAAPLSSSFKYRPVEKGSEAAGNPSRGPAEHSKSKKAAICNTSKDTSPKIASVLDLESLGLSLTLRHNQAQNLGLCCSMNDWHGTETSRLDWDTVYNLDDCAQIKEVDKAQSPTNQDDDMLSAREVQCQHSTAKPHMVINNAPKGPECLPRQGDTSIKTMREKRVVISG